MTRVAVAVEGRDTQCRGTISSVVGDGVPDRRGDRAGVSRCVSRLIATLDCEIVIARACYEPA
jgi:hypothetical protein